MFTAPSIVYHGPMNMDDLRKTANCIPQYGQDELGYVVSQPDVVMSGQPWGRRVAATYERVGRMFTPKDPWADRVRVTETDRVELCAQMLRDAPADELNTMLLRQSLSRAFLARGNCDEFTASQGITLSQMETAPHFILPYDMVQADRTLVQTFNAVSKFMSATAVAAHSHTGHIPVPYRPHTTRCASRRSTRSSKRSTWARRLPVGTRRRTRPRSRCTRSWVRRPPATAKPAPPRGRDRASVYTCACASVDTSACTSVDTSACTSACLK